MPIVELSETVLASLEESYGMICSPENYPQMFPCIQSVQVLERKLRGAKTSWVMDVEGLKFRWDQLDEYNLEDKTLHFSQIEGDMLRFEGQWSFSQLPEGTRITLYLDFDPGIPMLTSLFHFILMKKVREVVQELLRGFKDSIETSTLNNRGFPT